MCLKRDRDVIHTQVYLMLAWSAIEGSLLGVQHLSLTGDLAGSEAWLFRSLTQK